MLKSDGKITVKDRFVLQIFLTAMHKNDDNMYAHI